MKKIKRFIKSLVGNILRYVFRIPPYVIVNVDGGICSQMHQYLLGRVIAERGEKVLYNLDFFLKGGTDVTGSCLRPFVLLQTFPHLEFNEASSALVKLFQLLYMHVGNFPKDKSTDWVNLKGPVYLDGYYADPSNLYANYFDKYFKLSPKEVLDAVNLSLYESIVTEKSVAVHVRRGDLSTYNSVYGNPVTETYFGDAIRYMLNISNDFCFYFFSDGLDYVQDVLIPSVGVDFKYKLVSNTQENGHYDLLLISKCKHQITSKGSLGKMGALLGMCDDKVVVLSKDDNSLYMLDGFNCKIVLL